MGHPTFSVPLGTPVTYVGIWLMLVPSFSSPSSSSRAASKRVRRRRECKARLTHLSQELVDVAVDVFIGKVKLRDDAGRLAGESHGERAREGRDRSEWRGFQAHWLRLGLGRREEAGDEQERRGRTEEADGRRQPDQEQLGVGGQEKGELAAKLANLINDWMMRAVPLGRARIMGPLRGDEAKCTEAVP